MKGNHVFIGIDIGSVSANTVVIDENKNISPIPEVFEFEKQINNKPNKIDETEQG